MNLAERLVPPDMALTRAASIERASRASSIHTRRLPRSRAISSKCLSSRLTMSRLEGPQRPSARAPW